MAFYPRFHGVKRDYTQNDADKLKGTFYPNCNLAKDGAEKLWSLVSRGENTYVQAMGAMTG